MTPETIPAIWRTSDGDVVDAIARAVYGSERGGATEALLEANPGLADHGPVLAAGLLVRVPAPTPRGVAAPVRLWS